MSYSMIFYNVPQDQEVLIYDSNGSHYWSPTAKISVGFYDHPEELLSLVNKNLAKLYVENIPLENFPNATHPRFIYNKISRKVETMPSALGIDKSIKLFPYLDQELQEIFGIECHHITTYFTLAKRDTSYVVQADTKMDKVENENSDSLVGEETLDISGGINEIFVYCNIVKHSLVGDTSAQLLRIVPIPKESFGEVIVNTYNRPSYYPLLTDEIDTIEIDLKDKYGQRIKFNDGRVIIVLHFKQNEFV